MKDARCVMVLGTASGVGKSWLATALCRWYANAGLDVAPFKAQNMSNNARVVATRDGGHGEIGAAQYFQALAARVRPDVRMNPVLLKPEADTRSQVVVNGRVDAPLAAVPWRERSERLWPYAKRALHELRAAHDLLVIEGAGSPAEINLTAGDFVNTRTALAAGASCLLVADIDRGGAFAHLFGTHALMDAGVRALVRGFVLNRFRGDPTLLAPAPQELQAMTGVPTLAVVPFDPSHGLPEEDAIPTAMDRGGIVVAIVAAPHLSNHDEFEPLRHLPGVRLVWARDAAALGEADWLIVPGSKHTRADLEWLRAQRLDVAIAAHAAAGRPVLAICGGLQRSAAARSRHRRSARRRRWRCRTQSGARPAPAPHALHGGEDAATPHRALRRTRWVLGAAVGGGASRLRDPPRPHRAGRRPVAALRASRWAGMAARQRARRVRARALREPARSRPAVRGDGAGVGGDVRAAGPARRARVRGRGPHAVARSTVVSCRRRTP